MATIESTIQTLLGALVSGRCYPIVNASATITLPYITYQVIFAEPLMVTANSANPERVRMQIDVWAGSYGAVKVLGESIKTAMRNSTAFSKILEMSQDLY